MRGSTVALSDGKGEVVGRFGYGPYGEVVSGGVSTTPFLFNGMFGVMVDGNGLYYMRARFYSSEIKRFVNRDVVLGDISEGQSLNRYAFVSGRPVSLVDPFGLAQEKVDRAAEIVKTFLPPLYNDLAMPKIGYIPYDWFTRLWKFLGFDIATGGYTDMFGSIIINQDYYSSSFLTVLRKGRLNHKQREQQERKIEEILEVVIHEYFHSSDYQKYYTYYLLKTDPFFNSGAYGAVTLIGCHQYIYSRARLLAKFLNQYMLLTDKEWEQLKADKRQVEQIQQNLLPFLSWGVLISPCF